MNSNFFSLNWNTNCLLSRHPVTWSFVSLKQILFYKFVITGDIGTGRRKIEWGFEKTDIEKPPPSSKYPPWRTFQKLLLFFHQRGAREPSVAGRSSAAQACRREPKDTHKIGKERVPYTYDTYNAPSIVMEFLNVSQMIRHVIKFPEKNPIMI